MNLIKNNTFIEIKATYKPIKTITDNGYSNSPKIYKTTLISNSIPNLSRINSKSLSNNGVANNQHVAMLTPGNTIANNCNLYKSILKTRHSDSNSKSEIPKRRKEVSFSIPRESQESTVDKNYKTKIELLNENMWTDIIYQPAKSAVNIAKLFSMEKTYTN